MNRKTALVVLAVLVLVSPPVGLGQSKAHKIGVASHAIPGNPGFKLLTVGIEAFRGELERLGHVEGQTMSIQVRIDVEQPNKYELVVNLKTAQALGLMIPRAVLFRADRIIE